MSFLEKLLFSNGIGRLFFQTRRDYKNIRGYLKMPGNTYSFVENAPGDTHLFFEEAL